MNAVNHPITLQKVFFTRSVVIAIAGHEPKEGQPLPVPQNTLHVSKSEAQKSVRIATMKTLLNPNQEKDYPYSIDMECIALLSVDDTLSEAEADRGALITANSVCYGAIREAVSWLTGRQPPGELVLGLSVLRTAPEPSENEEHRQRPSAPP